MTNTDHQMWASGKEKKRNPAEEVIPRSDANLMALKDIQSEKPVSHFAQWAELS